MTIVLFVDSVTNGGRARGKEYMLVNIQPNATTLVSPSPPPVPKPFFNQISPFEPLPSPPSVTIAANVSEGTIRYEMYSSQTNTNGAAPLNCPNVTASSPVYTAPLAVSPGLVYVCARTFLPEGRSSAQETAVIFSLAPEISILTAPRIKSINHTSVAGVSSTQMAIIVPENHDWELDNATIPDWLTADRYEGTNLTWMQWTLNRSMAVNSSAPLLATVEVVNRNTSQTAQYNISSFVEFPVTSYDPVFMLMYADTGSVVTRTLTVSSTSKICRDVEFYCVELCSSRSRTRGLGFCRGSSCLHLSNQVGQRSCILPAKHCVGCQCLCGAYYFPVDIQEFRVYPRCRNEADPSPIHKYYAASQHNRRGLQYAEHIALVALLRYYS
jgi:hypothetical protein